MPDAKIVRGNDGKLKIENFYTPLAEAKNEMTRRWKDKKLRKKLKEFLGGNLPNIFKKEPRGIFARHVATPNLEHLHFLRKTSVAELKPLFLEYLEDKFQPENAPKYFLGKLFFVSRKGKNGGYCHKCLKILDFNKCSGKSINRISLDKNGQKVVDFHHDLLDAHFPQIDRFDISSWYRKNGGKPEKYYIPLMALFIQNGILFENYLLNSEEADFTKKIVLPSFLEIEHYFQCKPLIVRLLPSKNESESFWYWYPDHLKQYLVLK